MKKLFTLLLVFVVALASAQTGTTTVEYLKVNRQGLVMELPFTEKTVRDAIDAKMQGMGYKGKDSKGFTIYKGVRMTEIGPDSYDLYFLADRKSKKEKESSYLTILVSKGFDNFVADSNDTKIFNNTKTYLDANMRDLVAAYDLSLQIASQEEAVKKADKKYNGLIDDGQSLEKKRREIEKNIEDNKKDQANQKSELDKQRQILETLRAKKKN